MSDKAFDGAKHRRKRHPSPFHTLPEGDPAYPKGAEAERLAEREANDWAWCLHEARLDEKPRA